MNTTIYDINNSYYLYEDINSILSEIGNLYKVDFKLNKTIYTSKTVVKAKHSWLSDACKKEFNLLVIKNKSIVKDIYALIESIFKAKTGEFKKQELESKYINLKELRLLNNKFKHFDTKAVKIDLISLVSIGEDEHIIDCGIQYFYSSGLHFIRFQNLIDVFLKILEDERIISVERT